MQITLIFDLYSRWCNKGFSGFRINFFCGNLYVEICLPSHLLIAPSNVFSLHKQEPEKKADSEELDLFADSDEEAPVKPAKPSKKKAPKQDQV